MYDLIPGQRYAYNFAASPSGTGEFLGWTSFDWIVFRTDGKGDRPTFYNPALLCTITPIPPL